MDEQFLEKIASELAVSSARLFEVLEANKAKLVRPTVRNYEFLKVDKNQLLVANIHELISLGVSGKTAHNLFRLLEKYHKGTRIVAGLRDFEGRFVLSEAAGLRGIGNTSITEIKLLFDHIGFEYAE